MNMEEIIVYGSVFAFCALIFGGYLWVQSKKGKKVQAKIQQAKIDGVHEPVSLYPFIDPNACIGSGACVTACPEKDILGIVNGRAQLVNASSCIGHGACFHACPVEAISLKIGTEKRGVELPHVSQSFETNVKGIFIAGELGGMGLIKNSVEQGKQATEFMAKSIQANHGAEYDLVIIGAGPAGISASLQAKQMNLKALTLEQDSLGGTVFNFPRAKVVMTSAMDLPGHGKVKLSETSKSELLTLWHTVLEKNQVSIIENTKVEAIQKDGHNFRVVTNNGESYSTHRVLLAIGRRGSPRKLQVEGEGLEKVAYRLLEPELIQQKDILVVGGGDSAIESALLLAEQNRVILSYRSASFNRLKPKNLSNIQRAIERKILRVEFESVVKSIQNQEVILDKNGVEESIANDQVFIFAGGELPTQFLKNTGIEITKRFGHVMKSHT